MPKKDSRFDNMPGIAAEYIKAVVRSVGYTRKVRQEVCQELIDHFTDELAQCPDPAQREKRAGELIGQFGQAELLGTLIRRGKKRCRPLWKTAIVRGFQAVGVLIVCFALYVCWFVTGSPTISVDYLATLNQLARPTVPAQENAWENYKRVPELYRKQVRYDKETQRLLDSARQARDDDGAEFADLPSEQQQAIRRRLEDTEPAWQEFVAGSRKRYYWQQYAIVDRPDLLRYIFPQAIGHFRAMAEAGIWRSQIALEEQELEQAMEYCLAVARVGRHLQEPKGCLDEQSTGMHLSRLGHEQGIRIACSKKASAEQLAYLQKELETIYPNGYPLIDLEHDRLAFLDVVQHVYTAGGPGGGHLIPGKVKGALGYWQMSRDLELDVPRGLISTARGMLCAGRDETVAKANEYYSRADEIVKLTPYEKERKGLLNWYWDYIRKLGSSRFPIISTYLPSLQEFGEKAYQAKALHEATVTILALRRWQLAKGRYPENLSDLVGGGYLKSLPQDPYSDGPLVYRQEGDDFILYSVAANFTDDGGVQEPREEWPWGGHRVDYVFWPVQKAAK